MKKYVIFSILLAALLLNGCTARTVYEMYSLPQRSEEYHNLQAVIDMAMGGDMTYSAPQSGENRQTVQMADITGDGEEEYLVFAKGAGEKPMKMLVFSRAEDGEAKLMQVIDSTGSAFEQVEYVEMDGKPGLEIVVGRQVSDQLPRGVSVYSMQDQELYQLMSISYSRFLTCDLDSNGQMELMVIQPGTEERTNGIAMLYSVRDGILERSVEAEMSQKPENILRFSANKLESGEPAVYIASTVDENTIITDVFAMQDERFANISLSNDSGSSVKTLRNYYVYGNDVDGDGVLELPRLIGMKPLSEDRTAENQYLIRWFSLDIQGVESDKFYTFHNYQGGWYLRLDSVLASRISVNQLGNTYSVYIWDEAFENPEHLYTIYALTGSDRESQAFEDGRIALCTTDSVVYAARLEEAASQYGINDRILVDSFRLIYEEWKTAENS